MERLELYLGSEKAVKSANEFRAAVQRAAEASEMAGKGVDRLDRAFDKVGTGATRASAPIGRVGSEARRSGEAMRAGAVGAADYERKLGSLGRTAVLSGASITRLIALLGGVAAVRGAVRTFGEYEDKLAVLGAVAGATGEDLTRLEDAARRVSRETRLFRASDAVGGLTELARAGLDSSQSVAALKPTADLATVGLIGLDKAAGIVTKTLAQYAFSAEEAGRVADVLAKGANSTNTDVSGLAFSLSKAGVASKQFGVDLETTVAVLGELANKGIQADRAGTGLARIMIRLANPTERAKEALRELGLSVEDVNPAATGLLQVFRNLSAANLTLGQSTKLVDTEFADLLANISTSVPSIERLKDGLTDIGGTAATQAAARFNTLGGALSNLGGAAEEFAVSLGEGGLGEALKATANTGAEVLRVLTGDRDAFLEASEGSKLLADALRATVVAGTAFVGLKLGTAVGGTVTALRAATATTVALSAATGTLVTTSTAASRAMVGLSAAFAANPIGLIATAIGAAAAAFVIFGDSTDEATAALEQQQERVDELDRRYRTLGRAVSGLATLLDLGVTPDPADIRAAGSEVENLAKQFRAAANAGGDLQEIEGLERLRSILPKTSDAAGLLEIVKRFKQAQTRASELRPELEELDKRLQFQRLRNNPVGLDSLRERVEALRKQFTAADSEAERLNAQLAQQGVVVDNLGQVFIEPARGVEVLSSAFQRLESVAGSVGVALKDSLGLGDTSEISSIVSSLLQDEEQRVQLLQLQAKESAEELFLFRAKLAVSRELNDAEVAAVRESVKRIEAENMVTAQLKAQTKEAERQAELQERLPGQLDDVEAKLRRQLEIARADSETRTRLIAEQKAASQLPPLSLIDKADPERAAELRKQYEEIVELFVQVENESAKRRDEPREPARDTRRDDLIRQLEQEEEAFKLLGIERDRYYVRIDAENEARQAGLEIGSAEARDYVKRRQELEELARTVEDVSQLFGNLGDASARALERIAIDGARSRDVLRALLQDIQRILFQQTVSNNLQSLFQIAGQAVGGLFAGNGDPGYLDAPSVGPNLSGGVIPAMNGQLISSPTILDRGSRRYSVAEGGSVTPEAIFPLMRDSDGRLGVIAGGGGGASNITMVFPSVRNAQDARAARATLGQQVRRLNRADTRGQRGMRPLGQ